MIKNKILYPEVRKYDTHIILFISFYLNTNIINLIDYSIIYQLLTFFVNIVKHLSI